METYGLGLDFDKLMGLHELTYGLDYYRDLVDSSKVKIEEDSGRLQKRYKVLLLTTRFMIMQVFCITDIPPSQGGGLI